MRREEVRGVKYIASDSKEHFYHGYSREITKSSKEGLRKVPIEKFRDETLQTIAKLRGAFVKAIKLYLGEEVLSVRTKWCEEIKPYIPHRSGAQYIRHRVKEIKSKHTKKTNYLLIYVEIPQTAPSYRPEYIIIAIRVFWSKAVQKQHIERGYRKLMEKIRAFTEDVRNSEIHLFVYFIGRKFRQGALEYVDNLFREYRKMNINIRIKAIDGNFYEMIINDVINFLVDRVGKLLMSKGFEKSGYKIFSRPKHFTDFTLTIIASLLRDDEALSELLDLSRFETEVSVVKYIDILNSLLDKVKDPEIKKKKIPITGTPESITRPTDIEIPSERGRFERFEVIKEDVEVIQ